MLASPEPVEPCDADWPCTLVVAAGDDDGAFDAAGVGAASPCTTSVPFMLVSGLFLPVAVVPPWYTQ